MKKLFNQKGSLLAEALIAISITAIFAITVASLIMASIQSTKTGGMQTQSSFLAKEGIESVRSIISTDWNAIYKPLAASNKGLSYPYHPLINSNEWILSNGAENIDLGGIIYTREIFIFDVKRSQQNGTGNILTDGSGYDDPSTQLVTVKISAQGMRTIELSEYFSRWSNKIWKQQDWGGGSGQEFWPTNNSVLNKYHTSQDIDDSSGLKLLR